MGHILPAEYCRNRSAARAKTKSGAAAVGADIRNPSGPPSSRL
jgi:hypothetical protein